MMHKLLQRQIRRLERKHSDLGDRYEALLQVVCQTYGEADDERRKKDRSVALMSSELMEAHRQNQARTEAYLTSILAHVADGIIITDHLGAIRSFNSRAEEMFGWEANEVQGRQPHELFSEEMQSTLTEALLSSRGSQSYRSAEGEECSGRRKDGNQFPLEFSVSLISLQEERWNLILVRDITERVDAQNALIQALDRAEAAVRAKASFLSNMSHEIRTPMNAVLGLTNFLIDDHPREEQLETLKILKFSGDNLLVIINDILDFSKIEAGKIDLEEIDINLKEFLRSIKETFSARAAEKGLELRLEQDKSLPSVIKGDPVRLSQILNNLISNAIKFTEEGSVSLKIQRISTTDTHFQLLFEIEDTGIGIPEDKLSHIFENFTQSNSSTTRIFGGTGLGLAISKNLVELYDGKLEVRSEMGVGSCFSFEIEMKKSLEEPDKLISTRSSLPVLSSQSLDGTHILLVEDNKINQIVVSRYLERWGCTFSVAENGLEAVEKVQNESFALVLMDLHMPILDGYQATRKIRMLSEPRFQHLPIIALTASALFPVREEVEIAGMNGYVSKPFQPDDLLHTILTWTTPQQIPK